MSFHALNFRALLVASTAMLAPSLAMAQTADEGETATEDSLALGEVVVLGQFIPEVLRSTSEVAAFLAPEDLARQGDSDAASALARVTGLSIVEGRFVYVRGLGERYSAARLNGSVLPSPEPLQRVVPLDLFPTGILENVLVQKTYSVEYPGEFGGGIIDMTTLNIPNENFLSVKLGGSYNTETSLEPGLTYFGSDSDPAGFDDGTRDLPNGLADAAAQGVRVSSANFSDAQVQSLGRGFNIAQTMLLQNNDEIPLNGGFDISGGYVKDIGETRIGVIGVLGYNNDWQTRNGQEGIAELDAGNLIAERDFDFTATYNNVGWDGLVGLGFEHGDHEVTWTNLIIRRTSKEAKSSIGIDRLNSDGVVRDDRTAWYERELFSTQLQGTHFFGDFTVDWRAAQATTRRDVPYETGIRYLTGGLTSTFVYDPSGSVSRNSIQFSTLDDEVTSFGADLTYVMPLSNVRDLELQAGFEVSDNSRESATRNYRFDVGSPPLQEEITQSRVDFLFADFNITPERFVLRDNTGTSGAAAYDASLEVFGAYAKADWEIIPLVRAAFGLRFEDAQQSVTPRSLFTAEPDPVAPQGLEEQYVLPAATLTWNFAEDQQLRLGASKTIGRPQFRELAPQQYFDPDSNRSFTGNPFLQDTELLNLDARYEYYFGRNESFTVSTFYKQLDRPVESVVVTQSASRFQSYLNAPEATLYGAEIEFKKIFNGPESIPFLATKDLLVQANYTYTDSEVKAGAGDEVFPLAAGGQSRPATDFIRDGSRMTGQSEHVANLQLGWEDEENRSQLTLLTTYVSERSSARGANQEPDIIQDPGVKVDLVYRKGFDLVGRAFDVEFKAQNLTGENFEEFQELGDSRVDINTFDLGTTFSFAVKTEF